MRLGVGAAINCETGASDVGRFRPSDKRYQSGNLIHMTKAFERGDRDLGRRPFAIGGIQFSIKWVRVEYC